MVSAQHPQIPAHIHHGAQHRAKSVPLQNFTVPRVRFTLNLKRWGCTSAHQAAGNYNRACIFYRAPLLNNISPPQPLNLSTSIRVVSPSLSKEQASLQTSVKLYTFVLKCDCKIWCHFSDFGLSLQKSCRSSISSSNFCLPYIP